MSPGLNLRTLSLLNPPEYKKLIIHLCFKLSKDKKDAQWHPFLINYLPR